MYDLSVIFQSSDFGNVTIPNSPSSSYGPDMFLNSFQSERDLGRVSCVASNSVGRMEEERACLFHVILARRPTPPANCSLVEDPRGRPRMGLECQPGFGGGLRQVTYSGFSRQTKFILKRAPCYGVSIIKAG